MTGFLSFMVNVIEVVIKAGLLMLLAGLSGCVHYRAKPLSAEISIDTFESRSLTNTELRKYLENGDSGNIIDWPLTDWNLTRLTLAAFFYHPDLDLARSQWEVAKAGNKVAAERPNPTVGFQPGYDSTIPPPWILGGGIDIPLEIAGKRGYRITQSQHLSAAARFQIASTAWRVRSRVRRSLLDLYSGIETQVQLEKLLTIQRETVRLLEVQQKAGAVSSNEVAQSRISYNTTQSALQDAEKQRLEARFQLAAAIGIPAKALEGISFSFADFRIAAIKPDVSGLRRQAALNRTDILGALEEYAASQSALQVEIAKQYPDISLTPGYQLDQTDDKWSLGLSLTLPVFHRNQGGIALAQAKREETAARFLGVQSRALAEIDRALVVYNAALSKNNTMETLQTDFADRVHYFHKRFDAGDITKLELLAAEQEMATLSLARLAAQINTLTAMGDLEDALQSPLGWSEALWLIPPRQ